MFEFGDVAGKGPLYMRLEKVLTFVRINRAVDFPLPRPVGGERNGSPASRDTLGIGGYM